MGFHEYIIDGSEYERDVEIEFVVNSDFNATPIKIVFENCKGQVTVEGLDSEATARVFENRCDDRDLKVEAPPKNQCF